MFFNLNFYWRDYRRTWVEARELLTTAQMRLRGLGEVAGNGDDGFKITFWGQKWKNLSKGFGLWNHLRSLGVLVLSNFEMKLNFKFKISSKEQVLVLLNFKFEMKTRRKCSLFLFLVGGGGIKIFTFNYWNPLWAWGGEGGTMFFVPPKPNTLPAIYYVHCKSFWEEWLAICCRNQKSFRTEIPYRHN